jgi:hypothetical protein
MILTEATVNDEKTTEIELPKTVPSNIVRVNFTERRKAGNRPASTVRTSAQPVAYTLRPQKGPESAVRTEWITPWWVRLAALAAILVLSLFVL